MRRMKEEHPVLCEVTIGDVVAPRGEKAHPSQWPDLAYIGLEHVEPHTMRLLGHGRAGQMSSIANRFYSGDLLYSRLRPYLNKVITVDFDGLCSSEFIVIPSSKFVSSEFLKYLLSSAEFVAFANGLNAGDRPRVDFLQISSFNFFLPSSLTQTRIVEKLEELLSDLDSGVAELKAAQKKLAQYRQSLLKAAVEGALTAEWRAQRRSPSPQPLPPQGGGALPSRVGQGPGASMHLGDPGSDGASPSPLSPGGRGAGGEGENASELLQRILTERRARWEAKQLAKFKEQGKTPPKDWRKKYPEPVQPDTSGLPELPEGWVWASVDQLSPDDLANGRSVPTAEEGAKVLRLTAVKDGRIDLRERKVGAWSENEAKPFAVVDGDLLIVRGNGSLSLVGRAGLVGHVEEQVAYPDTMIRLRVMDAVVSPSWIGLVWDSHIVRTHLERRARTSAGIYKIAQPDIASVPVPVPGLPEQVQILELCVQYFEQVSATHQAIEAGLRQSTAQRQNILRAAFAGLLVPQDPNDEPASLLLERIRAERAECDTMKKSRGRKTREAE